jgi:transcriptional regulator with XRE-family HTH domain
MSSTSSESTGQKLLRLRKRYGISRRQVSVILNLSELTVLRSELLPNHRNHALVARQLEKIVEILESRSKTDE